MLRGNDATAIAVITFPASKNAFGKARRAYEHFANSRYFDNVYTDGNDHK